MLEEILVGNEALEHGPGRVRMLEFVGIEEANGNRRDAGHQKAGNGDEQESLIDAQLRIATPRLAQGWRRRPSAMLGLHLAKLAYISRFPNA